MKLKGHISIREFDGSTLYEHHNVITTVGLTRTAELLGGLSTDFVDRMAIGDGAATSAAPSAPTVPTEADTGLSHELFRTSSVNPTIVGVDQLKFESTFLTSSPIVYQDPLFKAINEAGLFLQDDDQPTPGTTPSMFARRTFPSIPFDPTDRQGVIITWTITIV